MDRPGRSTEAGLQETRPRAWGRVGGGGAEPGSRRRSREPKAAGCLGREGGLGLRFGSGREERTLGAQKPCPWGAEGGLGGAERRGPRGRSSRYRTTGLCCLFRLGPRFSPVDCVTQFSRNVTSSIEFQFLFRPEGFHKSLQLFPVVKYPLPKSRRSCFETPSGHAENCALLTLVTLDLSGLFSSHAEASSLPVLSKGHPSQETRNQPSQLPRPVLSSVSHQASGPPEYPPHLSTSLHS